MVAARLAQCPKDKAALYPFFGQWLRDKVAASGRSQHIDKGIAPAEVAHLLQKIITVRHPNARYAPQLSPQRSSAELVTDS
jgi:hypothetical protein